MEDSAKIEARFAAVGRSRTFGNLVGTFGLKNKRVLDIGCSYGEHVAHFGPQSVGLTIEPTEAAYGTKRGLDIRLGNAENALPVDEPFDAIYCSNLLEHLYSPHAFLYKLRSALGPDGTLILGVPVLPFPRFLTRFKKFRGALAEQHINFFVGSTLAYTVARAGWKVRTVRGFRFKFAPFDRLLGFLYPHLYVIATPDPSFSYSEKRERELAGYKR